ncbi:predicted protein [Nematostella vectensis]|uniref:Protein HTATIP2 n=1 Tax=Nematostella vectensis TaxID=45351 RepID=A7SF50_NEMVE|nr:predicted protein [Nematostella vectensis]|eukprot:XP_001629709.1 predicted protein [Nematostella vectensis]
MAANEGVSHSTQESESNMLGLRAVLVGATGSIGECLLGEVLASKNFSKVIVLGRRDATAPSSYQVDQKVEESSGRLEQHKIDFETLSKETVGQYFTDKDVFFCTLGSTRKQAGSANNFRHIDYDYVVNCANVAKECEVKSMVYVSSYGANPNSMLLYTEVKGKVEEALKKLQFPHTTIYRPGLLSRGDKARFVEKIYAWFVSSIPVATVAKAMRVEVEGHFSSKQTTGASAQARTLFNSDIYKLAEEK